MKTKKYIDAHPESNIGDPNAAYKLGWVLVAIKPNGLLVYRRKHWWE